MTELSSEQPYFPHSIQISAHHWHSLALGELSRRIAERGIPEVMFFRQLALKLNRGKQPDGKAVQAGHLVLYAALLKIYRHIIDVVGERETSGLLLDALLRGGV